MYHHAFSGNCIFHFKFRNICTQGITMYIHTWHENSKIDLTQIINRAKFQFWPHVSAERSLDSSLGKNREGKRCVSLSRFYSDCVFYVWFLLKINNYMSSNMLIGIVHPHAGTTLFSYWICYCCCCFSF